MSKPRPLPTLSTILRNVRQNDAEDLATERAKLAADGEAIRLRSFLIHRARLAGGDGGALRRRLDASGREALAPNTPGWIRHFRNR